MIGEFVTELKRDRDFSLFVKKSLEEKKQVSSLREVDYIRASSILDFCPRLESMKIAHKINDERKDTCAKKVTMTMGRSFETAFRDDFLGDLNVVVGKWQCVACRFTQQEVEGRVRYLKPLECVKCHSKHFRYQEEFLIDTYYKVGGHPDGFYCWRDEVGVLEMKTSNSFFFKQCRQRPLEPHIAQIQIYLFLSKLEKAYIWYFNKDTSEFVSHRVLYNANYAVYLLEKGKAMFDFFDSGRLPDRICIDSNCTKASKCVVKDLCFASGSGT